MSVVLEFAALRWHWLPFITLETEEGSWYICFGWGPFQCYIQSYSETYAYNTALEIIKRLVDKDPQKYKRLMRLMDRNVRHTEAEFTNLVREIRDN